jgi:tetratricopeptide (TPR) repeat protein
MRYAILAIALCIVGSGVTLAQSLDAEVSRLCKEGKYAEAEPLAKQALEQSIRKNGPEHEENVKPLQNLAIIHSAEGKYDLALPLFKQELAIQEKSLGLDDPRTALTFFNLAGNYAKQGKYELAEFAYERALAILDRSFGEGNARSVQIRKLIEMMNAKRDAAAAAK